MFVSMPSWQMKKNNLTLPMFAIDFAINSSFRHPHVYPPSDIAAAGLRQGIKIETASDVSMQWEQLKQLEKDGNETVLSGVPNSLPALIKAYRVQDKARNVGFDWEERSQVWEKVKEELAEFEAEVENMDKDKAEAEFGDLMFSLINAARLYKINPDNALERTNQKFIRRFNYLESQTLKKGRKLTEMSLEEMDKYWEEPEWVRVVFLKWCKEIPFLRGVSQLMMCIF